MVYLRVFQQITKQLRKEYIPNLLENWLFLYIIMWAVGLSNFLSVRLLIAYGNQNPSTHIKAKHNSEIPTLCRTIKNHLQKDPARNEFFYL